MGRKHSDQRPFQQGVTIRTLLGYIAEILNDRALARTGLGHIQERTRTQYGRSTSIRWRVRGKGARPLSMTRRAGRMPPPKKME